jgi:hypothetical protein
VRDTILLSIIQINNQLHSLQLLWTLALAFVSGVLDINFTEGLATDHLNTGFLGFPLCCPKFEVATARFPQNPPGLDLSKFDTELWRPPNLLSKL